MKSSDSPPAHHLPLKRQPFETNRRIVPSITIHHETVIAFTILLLLRLPTYLHGTDRILAVLLCSGGWIDRKGNDWIIVAKMVLWVCWGKKKKKTCQSRILRSMFGCVGFCRKGLALMYSFEKWQKMVTFPKTCWPSQPPNMHFTFILVPWYNLMIRTSSIVAPSVFEIL